jgi:hypothetical protein
LDLLPGHPARLFAVTQEKTGRCPVFFSKNKKQPGPLDNVLAFLAARESSIPVS